MSKGKYEEWLTEENLLRIRGWARNGLTNKVIAKNMGITEKTLYEWQNAHGEIREALKKGKEVIDIEAENALLKAALGYDYEESIQEMRTDKKTGKRELVLARKVKKHIPPNVTALIFWLKNRKPEDWRDKQEVDNKVNITPIVIRDDVKE